MTTCRRQGRDKLVFGAAHDSRRARMQWGTARNLASNVGSRRVGRASPSTSNQRRRLSRPGRRQDAEAAARLTATTSSSDPGRHPDQGTEADRVEITGADRQKVGQLAAEIRSLRPPEPYKARASSIRPRRSVARKARRSKGESTMSDRNALSPAANGARATPAQKPVASARASAFSVGQAHLCPGHR